MKKTVLLFVATALIVGALPPQVQLSKPSEGATGASAQTSRQGMNSVNLAAPPKPYKGWEVETNLPGVGLLEWAKGFQVPIQLFVAPGSKLMHGPEFLDSLKGKEACNRNLMDYLLIHQEEIPGAFRERTEGLPLEGIFFPGTIYAKNGKQLIPGMFKPSTGTRWLVTFKLVDSPWGTATPVAIYMKSSAAGTPPSSK